MWIAMVYQKYKAVEPWIEPAEPQPEREHLVPNEVIMDLRKVMSCTMCWLCDEGCSTIVVDKKFLGSCRPHQGLSGGGRPQGRQDQGAAP